MDDIAPQVLDPSLPLSYDDNVAYEAQLPTAAELEAEAVRVQAVASASLANRIGTSKVYLLSETSRSAVGGKRKHDDADVESSRIDEDDVEMEEELSHRGNALLLTGSPIANLPTTRIFAYATHFDAHPLGLEWVDDNTCVLVFPARKDARDAFRRLQKPAADASAPETTMVVDDCIPARPFPVALWPPEERISQTLKLNLKDIPGQSHSEARDEGLKGPIRMRWARHDDVKKKGAMRESKFYKRHGVSAGKEVLNGRDMPPPKRRRGEDDMHGNPRARSVHETEEMQRARLDNELDQFLAEDDDASPHSSDGADEPLADANPDADDVPASPPSKMRSDYIARDGRTLLERTSNLRIHNASHGHSRSNGAGDLASRLTLPLPRRRGQRRSGGGGGGRDEADFEGSALSDRLQPRSWGESEKLEWGRGRGRRGDVDDVDSLGEGDVDGDRRRRRRGGGGGGGGGGRDRDRDRPARPSRTAERPKKTQQELDDELDAFLRAS
ncbi:hypothetical protein GALMADRAFT_250360 [Galerina marginata CBS 339.88]|uniref:Chromatin target of PRMT1 protein C-terminal domain-containing protein n=1 Tax=Galerina marginata (strain CBS 339.88) TaxID=685588 RepID=A0A067T602_GALM3|nr:hypothetical protein GALMADRAFT_250360 [Galerina marginata CBS 339.88]